MLNMFKYFWIISLIVKAQDLPSLEEITNPTSSSSSTTSSTTKPITTSTLSPDLENLLPEGFKFNWTQFVPGQFCHCDILEKACDVNCCCDPDCTDQDILAFSKCQEVQVQTKIDPKFCFSSEISVKNNTKLLVEEVSVQSD